MAMIFKAYFALNLVIFNHFNFQDYFLKTDSLISHFIISIQFYLCLMSFFSHLNYLNLKLHYF